MTDTPSRPLPRFTVRQAEHVPTTAGFFKRPETDGGFGRAPGGVESRYLLGAGLAHCGLCHGSFTVRTRAHGNTKRAAFYRCVTNTQKGHAICRNDREMSVTRADQAALGTIERHLLRPAVIEAALRRAINGINSTDLGSHKKQLEARLLTLERELANLSQAIAAGETGRLETLTVAIRELEAERVRLRQAASEIDARLTIPQLSVLTLRTNLAQRLTDWQGLLQREAIAARQALKKLLAGPLVFEPRTDGSYRFSGQGRLDQVLAGIIPALSTMGMSPTGFEPVFPD